MSLTDPQLKRLTEVLLRDLLEQGRAVLKGDRPQALACIEQTLREHFAAEQELDREARRLLEAHLAAAPAGIDRHKVLQMIRRRLADEKGFPL